MGWIGGLLGVLIFLALMIAYPGFRTVVIAIAVLAGIGIAAVQYTSQKRLERSYSVIAHHNLAFEDVKMISESYVRRFVARVKNNSNHNVASIEIIVRVFDCPNEETIKWRECEAIGQDIVSLYQSIPPNQVRQVDGMVHFSAMPAIRGKFVWNYEVQRIRAQLD